MKPSNELAPGLLRRDRGLAGRRATTRARPARRAHEASAMRRHKKWAAPGSWLSLQLLREKFAARLSPRPIPESGGLRDELACPLQSPAARLVPDGKPLVETHRPGSTRRHGDRNKSDNR